MSRIDPIHVTPTTERKTESSRFGDTLRAAAAGVADGIASGVGLAAPFVPGGLVLSAAVRGAGRAVSAAASSPSTPGRATGDGGGDVIEATRALQQEAQSFNLQYLQIQEGMQRESREFTALTNVMKVKHDSAKAAINNIH
jgi:hypothetical protein